VFFFVVFLGSCGGLKGVGFFFCVFVGGVMGIMMVLCVLVGGRLCECQGK